MKLIVFDTEGDGLAYDCTKLWIMSWTTDGKNYLSTDNYEEMKYVLEQYDLRVCHNSIRHDMVALNRIIGLPMDYTKFVDTLALSWYLFPKRDKHGLEAWGETLGYPKVDVDPEEWKSLTWERAKERCERDTEINWHLWKKCEGYLEKLYG